MRKSGADCEARQEKARAERLRVTVQGTAFVTQYNYPAVGGRAPADSSDVGSRSKTQVTISFRISHDNDPGGP